MNVNCRRCNKDLSRSILWETSVSGGSRLPRIQSPAVAAVRGCYCKSCAEDRVVELNQRDRAKAAAFRAANPLKFDR